MTDLFRILDPRTRSAEFAGKCALAIMAKAPRPGRVKTRLSPPLTPEQASALNACFLRDTVASLGAAALETPAEWVVSYTPAGEESAFHGILPPGALLVPQRGEGFGERLLHTVEDLLTSGFSSVCLIDSDSPTVPTAEYVVAVRYLAGAGEQAVLGPSEDGGYYLLGVQSAVAKLFERIAWSTPLVAEQTMARASEIKLPVRLLRRWYDVDDATSLRRLEAELFHSGAGAAQGYLSPHTREYLAEVLKHSTDGVALESAV